ncbi:hypothetical protein FA15DRAFT_658598 [Coprinopsis marcescibilis]|uniref:Uncharacterized protein n=1 Tax=Coprinopsis marcescibilis TaxID=230819 RepID=A0A5C3KMH8_COPMA|nr:hypothetical protein FA15DRAFT_658598 [Coprinopsis marcescibilis]
MHKEHNGQQTGAMSMGSKRQGKQVRNRWQLGQVLQQVQRAQWARQAAIEMGAMSTVGRDGTVGSEGGTYDKHSRRGWAWDREGHGSCNKHKGQLGRSRRQAAPVTSTKGGKRGEHGRHLQRARRAGRARQAWADSGEAGGTCDNECEGQLELGCSGRGQVRSGRGNEREGQGAQSAAPVTSAKGRQHSRQHLRQVQRAQRAGSAATTGSNCNKQGGRAVRARAAPATGAKGREARSGCKGQRTQQAVPAMSREGARGREGAMSAVVACPGVEQWEDEEAQPKWEQGGNREREERLMGGLSHDLLLPWFEPQSGCIALDSSFMAFVWQLHSPGIAFVQQPHSSHMALAWPLYGLHTAAVPALRSSRTALAWPSHDSCTRAMPEPCQGCTSSIPGLHGRCAAAARTCGGG